MGAQHKQSARFWTAFPNCSTCGSHTLILHGLSTSLSQKLFHPNALFRGLGLLLLVFLLLILLLLVLLGRLSGSGHILEIILSLALVLLALLLRGSLRVHSVGAAGTTSVGLGGDITTEVLNHTMHDINVLTGGDSGLVELEALLDLLTELVSELVGGLLTEGIDTGSHGALVGEETRDTSLVLGGSTSNEGRVEDETVLGGVSLGLEGAEEGLLGTEDLNSRGRVLGEVGQGSGVADKTGSDLLSDEGGKVRSTGVHLGHEVVVELLAVLRELDHALGEAVNVDEINLGNVGSHGHTGGVKDLLGLGSIHGNLLESGERVLAELLLVLDEGGKAAELVVVVDNLGQLGEVPRVPLTNAHSEGVEVLVELVEKGNTVDDHVIGLVHVELDLGTGVRVTETEDSLGVVFLGKCLEEASKVETDTTDELQNSVVALTVDSQRLLDNVSNLVIDNSQRMLGLLTGLGLGEVHLQPITKVGGYFTLRNVVDVVESILGRLEGEERLELHHLAETGQVGDALLNISGAAANLLVLNDLEQTEA